MTLTQMNLRDVRSVDGALTVARMLGYLAEPLPLDGSAYGLAGDAIRLRSEQRVDRGYGIVIGSATADPRSFKTLGRRLVETVHDSPLAIVGLPSRQGDWRQAVVVRPKLIEGGGGAVSIARLTIDPTAPTAHDVEVMNGLLWAGRDEAENQRQIDEALDVERVTKRFFKGLSEHHQRLVAAVEAAAAADAGVGAGVAAAQGAERVGLRIVTQLLFCYFLQRKGLLEERPRWLREQFEAFAGAGRDGFYARVLEPLFYEAFAVPTGDRGQAWRDRPRIPFLNGGLFERTYGVSLDLPDSVFSTHEGLLGFLDRWTFTISEEAADEHEVAVDPEMLGKVFENLVSDDEVKREGTVYTPRPVVQFMCREALVPYLERTVGLDEAGARGLLTDDDALASADHPDPAALARRLDEAVRDCTVLDPAVGSGAFPLGMLTELVRLRRIAHKTLTRREPTAGELWDWKLHAVERSLYGVDINPGAVELCRLRLWLALLVEEETGDVHPLPNLDYRVICADSLTDFLGGFEVQQTRRGALTMGLGLPNTDEIVRLREDYFEESRPARKQALREQLAAAEDEVVTRIFRQALENARLQRGRRDQSIQRLGETATVGVAELQAAYGSRDRRFPLFVPAFHAPEIARASGWAVVIMNPPYVGRKEVAQRLPAYRIADLESHYGRTADLMIHFASRAFELVKPGGSVSMIFNDSIFTSEDADDLRRSLFGSDVAVRCLARSRCFEGKAVNGGVIVAVNARPDRRPIRWVENHGRPTTDLAGASRAMEPSEDAQPIGASELWCVAATHYERLPHRPLFRPSRPAIRLLDAYDRCVAWRDFGRYAAPAGSVRGADWQLLSDTRALESWRRTASLLGFYDRLKAGEDFLLLGLVIDGGQGLATADDRRFLAAVAGSPDEAEVRSNQARFMQLAGAKPGPARVIREQLRLGRAAEDVLLALNEQFRSEDLGWPRIGLIRVVDPALVRRGPITRREVENGINGAACWLPYEKGDSSDDGGGSRWARTNPLAIDWSPAAVGLLRQRARQAASARKPYFRNEHVWGLGGVTWNRIASYLRTRLVPEGSIFSDKAPTIRPAVDWLTPEALMALLNAPVTDFLVRTFLGSRLQIELGHLRRFPIPVLDERLSRDLDDLGRRAVQLRLDGAEGQARLDEIEVEIDRRVRELYGIGETDDLWVVR